MILNRFHAHSDYSLGKQKMQTKTSYEEEILRKIVNLPEEYNKL